MPVRESHTVSVQGDLTIADLEHFVAKAKAAGAGPDTRVVVQGERGDQRDRIPPQLTATIA